MAQVVSEDFTVARDGLTLQGHVEYPQGSTHDRVVICMHGFLRDMGVKPGGLYQDISDALTAHGMTCVRFDFNGRGRSEGAFEDSDVFNQIEDAIAVLNHVRDAYDPLEISLLGHSQGGVVAGMTAGMFSDVIHTLVMLAPAASLKDDALRGELLGTVRREPRATADHARRRPDNRRQIRAHRPDAADLRDDRDVPRPGARDPRQGRRRDRTTCRSQLRCGYAELRGEPLHRFGPRIHR